MEYWMDFHGRREAEAASCRVDDPGDGVVGTNPQTGRTDRENPGVKLCKIWQRRGESWPV